MNKDRMPNPWLDLAPAPAAPAPVAPAPDREVTLDMLDIEALERAISPNARDRYRLRGERPDEFPDMPMFLAARD